MSPELRHDRRDMNRRLAHITMRSIEITADNQNWEFARIWSEIESALRVFFLMVPQSRLSLSIPQVVADTPHSQGETGAQAE